MQWIPAVTLFLQMQKYSRETFITEILKTQLADGVGGNTYGGWVLGGYGSTSDIDMTAMAVQALAPYYNSNKKYTYTNGNTGKEETRTVRECVDDAIEKTGQSAKHKRRL